VARFSFSQTSLFDEPQNLNLARSNNYRISKGLNRDRHQLLLAVSSYFRCSSDSSGRKRRAHEPIANKAEEKKDPTPRERDERRRFSPVPIQKMRISEDSAEFRSPGGAGANKSPLYTEVLLHQPR
jgi:hypothetical protein